MVHLSEIRIVMPFTVEEFKRGQRYGNWKTNENAQEPGQGGTLLSSTPYYHEVYGEGMFTHSLFRLGNRLPEWVDRLVPPSALVVDEKSWISYPYMRTVITIPFFSRLKMEIESIHLDDDRGDTPNALNLPEDLLAIRKIDMMDLGSEKVAARDYYKELDPELVRPKSTGRGPLTPGWQKREKTLMCAYKVIKAEAGYWGLGARVEKLLISSLRQILLLAHKNTFGLTDEWYHLSYDEVMALEAASHEKLNLGKGTISAHELGPPGGAEEEAVPDKEGEEQGLGTVEVASEASGVVAGGGEREGEVQGQREAEEAEGEREPVGGSSTGEEGYEEMGVEFFEAEMQWSLEEELYAEELLGESFGSKRTAPVPQSTLPDTPEACPVCSAGGLAPASESKPSLFCAPCGEFFCPRCFPLFHCTTRLKAHMSTQVTAAPTSSQAAPSAITTAAISGPASIGSAPQAVGEEAQEERSSGTHAGAETEAGEASEGGVFKGKEGLASGVPGDPSEREGKRKARKEKKERGKEREKEKEKGGKGRDKEREKGKVVDWASMKDPPLNLEQVRFLRRSAKKGASEVAPSPVGTTPGRDQEGGQSGDSAPESAPDSAPAPLLPHASSSMSLTPLPTETRLEQTLPEATLRELQERYRGKPVELSGALVSCMLDLYRSVGTEAEARGGMSERVEVDGESSTEDEEKIAQKRAQGEAEGTPVRHEASSLPGTGNSGIPEALGGVPQAQDGLAGAGNGQERGLLGNLVVVRGGQYREILESLFDCNLQAVLTFRALAALLQQVDPTTLGHDEKFVFWVNTYNALAMHGYLVYGIPRSHYKRIMFLNKVSYLIGGLPYSLLAIEHSLLRAASHRPKLAGLLPVQKLKPGDSMFGSALDRPEPLVTFALSCGSASSPPVQVYSVETVRFQLQVAASWYLGKFVDLSQPNKVTLPKLLQWYGKDLAPSTPRLLEWIASHCPDAKKAELVARSKRRGKKGEDASWEDIARTVQVATYAWSWTYVLGHT